MFQFDLATVVQWNHDPESTRVWRIAGRAEHVSNMPVPEYDLIDQGNEANRLSSIPETELAYPTIVDPSPEPEPKPLPEPL